jgi:hypothetical protein
MQQKISHQGLVTDPERFPGDRLLSILHDGRDAALILTHRFAYSPLIDGLGNLSSGPLVCTEGANPLGSEMCTRREVGFSPDPKSTFPIWVVSSVPPAVEMQIAIINADYPNYL